MTTEHHTGIPYHSPATAAALNAPLDELDAAIVDLNTRVRAQPLRLYTGNSTQLDADAVLDAMFASYDTMKPLLDNVDVYGFDGVHIQDRTTKYSAMLTRAFAMLDAHGIAVGVEVGGPLGYYPPDVLATDTGGQNGYKSALHDITLVIEPVVALGGTVGYLRMDGGLRRTILNGQSSPYGVDFSIADACTEVVSYMQTINASYPNIKFTLVENQILWPYDGAVSYAYTADPADAMPDLLDTLNELFSQLDTAGILNLLVGFESDAPIEYLDSQIDSVNKNADDWYARLLKLQDQCAAVGVKFGQINNTAWGANSSFDSAHDGAPASDVEYRAGMLRATEQVERYRRTVRPDMEPWGIFAFDNWMEFPTTVSPPSHELSNDGVYLSCLKLFESFGDDTLAQPLYREGRWKPRITFGGNAVGVTYSEQSGFWTLNGRELSIVGRITLTSKGSSTGAVAITSLPFPAAAYTYAGGHFAYYAAMASIAVPRLLIAPEASSMSPQNGSTTDSSAMTNANFTNGSDIIFFARYLI